MLSIRYPKANTLFNLTTSNEEISIGTWEVLLKGSRVCILTFGSMISNAIKVANINENNVTVVNCRFIKPIDEKLLNKLISQHDFFITIEEGIISGGFGSSILHYIHNLRNKRVSTKIYNICFPDYFVNHAPPEYQYKSIEMDCDSFEKKIFKYLEIEGVDKKIINSL